MVRCEASRTRCAVYHSIPTLKSLDRHAILSGRGSPGARYVRRVGVSIYFSQQGALTRD